MSLTLSEVQNKVAFSTTFSINQFTGSVYKSSGLPIGCLYQDKTRCIYEGYTYDNGIHALENMEFLSHFKHKHLLTIKIDSYTRHIYVLQGIL